MFNVFLPKMLEMNTGGRTDDDPKTLEETMWDVVIFTIAGCPGALVRSIPLPLPFHHLTRPFFQSYRLLLLRSRSAHT